MRYHHREPFLDQYADQKAGMITAGVIALLMIVGIVLIISGLTG